MEKLKSEENMDDFLISMKKDSKYYKNARFLHISI